MSLNITRDLIASRLPQEKSSSVSPLNTNDPFIASSCLHKSLRQGEYNLAVASAKALLHIDPDRLWKRLSVIVFEEFGLSDLAITQQVIAAASSRTWRSTVGDDARIFSYLIECLCVRPRDRRATELYVLALALEEGQMPHLEIASGVSSQLRDLVGEAQGILRKCERSTMVRGRAIRSTRALECDQFLQEKLIDCDGAASSFPILSQARRTTQTLLPLMVALWLRSPPPSKVTIVHRRAPILAFVGGIPTCAMDGFTRIGKEALRLLAKEIPAIRKLVGGLPTAQAKSYALSEALFEVEGGVCTTEKMDELYAELRRWSIGCLTGLRPQDFLALMELVQAVLPRLNEIRECLYVRNLR